MVNKGTVCIKVLMYVIHKFELTIGKFVEGAAYEEASAVHAWDEGAAIHIGNSLGNTGTVSGNLYT